MLKTESGITFTPEEIMAAAEIDERPLRDLRAETPSAWYVEYDVDSLFFGTSFCFKHRCDTEAEATAYAASHALAHNIKVYPVYPLR